MVRISAARLTCIGLAISISGCTATPQPKAESAATLDAKRSAPKVAETAKTDANGANDQPPKAELDADGQTARASAEDASDAKAAALPPWPEKATPIDVMTAGGTAYILDYQNSGALEFAQSGCAEKAAKAEQAARAELVAKAAKEQKAAEAAKSVQAPATKVSEKHANKQDGKQDDKQDDKQDAKADEAAEQERAARRQAALEANDAALAEEVAIDEKVAAVRAECVRQARDKFAADVLRFRRDGLGHIQLVIFQRNGTALKEQYVARIELKQIAPNTVKVEIKEPGTGKRPIMRDRNAFEVTIPNAYSIELTDPQFGKLPYGAKVGFVAN